jgi:hypothetical protein
MPYQGRPSNRNSGGDRNRATRDQCARHNGVIITVRFSIGRKRWAKYSLRPTTNTKTQDMQGQCRLCLRSPVELKNSHFMPAGVYRLLRDESSTKNPNPVAISRKAAVQTSRQITASLLCGNCEGRLSKNGENWVLRHCLRKDDSFPLSAILRSTTPDFFGPRTTTKIYRTARVAEINVDALAYFAASIFWRGSIHTWNDDGSVPIRLGPYQERFRRYLLSEGSFPEDCFLWVVVREPEGSISRLTYFPIGKRAGGFHVYKFPMPGLAFTLLVGKSIPTKYREICLVQGKGNPIVVSDVLEGSLMEEALRMIRRVPPKKNAR